VIAYPRPSFPEPVLAPDVEPDEGTLVQVCFNEQWLPLVQGALSQLQLPATWLGDDDARALAVGRATNLKGLFVSPVCEVEGAPTPYWDEDTEVDDELPPDTQPWYGHVDDPTELPTEDTFRETLEDWTFAGLLAIAGAPGAALAFLTIAPRFRLAFKQGDIGKIIRVFVDAQQAVEITDSGDGSVLEVPIIADPALETHQIYVTVGDA